MIPSPHGAHRPGGTTPKEKKRAQPDGERPWRALGYEDATPAQNGGSRLRSGDGSARWDERLLYDPEHLRATALLNGSEAC